MNTNFPAVTASAPGKLMLSIGYAVVHGYSTVATAVDQRLRATVAKNNSDWFHLQAPDLGLTDYSKQLSALGTDQLPKSVRFIETFYKNFLKKHPQSTGISVTTSSDFSASYGFGSSSAVTVAFAKALMELYGLKISNKELFDLTYHAVLEVQGVGSGYDLAAAIWGGTLRYVKPAKTIEPIIISGLPLIIAYTGEKADTPTLVRVVNSLHERHPQKIGRVFKEIDAIALGLETALTKKDWPAVGKFFQRSQQAARELEVSNIKIEKLVEAAEKAGAYGATCSGAGGGDCVLAIAERSTFSQVREALEQAGAKILDVKVNAPGVRIELN
ncbi:MAG: hypothetical protein ABII10_00660 [Candidatus Paceibacterota bacterium]